MGRFLSSLAATLLAATALACSSAATPANSSDAGSVASGVGSLDAALVDGSDSLCATDPRGEVYAPGLVAKGASGALSVTLETATPAPPGKGNNEWTITVVDASGQPVDGLAMKIKPFMPDHGHGSSITPQVASLGSGKYDVTLINLFMPGIWTITFTFAQASDGGSQAVDSAVFTFCVSG